MPSGRDFIVERVEDGKRRVLFETRGPFKAEILQLAEDDHVHLLIGLPEELGKFAPVEIPVTIEYDDEKPKPKRKSAAKKAT